MEKETQSEANHQSVHGLGDAAPGRQLQAVQTDSLRSWLVVLGSFCTLICTFGAVSSYGVFQAHYKSSLLSEYSASQISWIGAIQYLLLFFLGLPAGYLADIGYTRHLMVTGSVIVIVSQLCISWCAKYWQFLLVQGIIYGIGCGSLFTPACAEVQPWFEKRRGLALGVIACGAAAGGVICSIIASSLLPQIGFSWASRVLALLFLVLLGVACALIKPYPISMGTNIGVNDPDVIASWESRLRITFPAIFEPTFILYLCGLFCATAGVYLPFNFLQQYVGDIGLSGPYSKYMTAYVNASSILGRLGGGILADRIGPLRCIVPALICCAVLCFVWTQCHTKPTVLLHSLLFGIPQGVDIALIPAGARAVAQKGLGKSLGLGFTIQSFAALSAPPIFGALIDPKGGSSAYLTASIFGGSMLAGASVAMLLVLRLVRRRDRTIKD